MEKSRSYPIVWIEGYGKAGFCRKTQKKISAETIARKYQPYFRQEIRANGAAWYQEGLTQTIKRKGEKDMTTNENSVIITGTAVSPYYFSHAIGGRSHYKVFIATQRLSGVEDIIPVIVPENCLEDLLDPTDQPVTVKGSFQSRNRHCDGKRHLDLFVYADIFTFARSASNTDNGSSAAWKDDNCVYLEGYITKQPIFRTTPKGRQLSDLLVAVNGPNPRHANYIPCIAWGRNAYLASSMQTEDYVRIGGRVQSREYDKILHKEGSEVDIVQKRVAYEVSCFTLEVLRKIVRVTEKAV